MEKRGLGKGLAALISEAAPNAGEGEVRAIPLTQLVPNPHQPRTHFDTEKMDDLAASVREHGILQPILVKRIGHEQYQLVAGERRFRAAQKVGLAVIPALIKDFSSQEQLEVAIIENLQREDIGVMETARAYKKLIDEFSMLQEMVAQRVGKSRSAISNTLRLLKLPKAIQTSIESGQLSEGHARAILTAEGDDRMLEVWEIVLRNDLTVRETEKIARVSRETLKIRKTAETERQAAESALESTLHPSYANDANEADFANRLQERLGTKVVIRRMFQSVGKIEIEFYSEEDLIRVAEILIGPQ